MTTINSLAPETLAYVLELAAERGPDGRPAFDTLASASVVARRWQEPAQAQMWRTLDVGWWDYRVDYIPRITSSAACGRWRTTWLTLRGNMLGAYGTVHNLLEKLRRLEGIVVNGYCGGRFFETNWMGLPSLAGVKELSINTRFPDVLPTEIHPAFRLRVLRLGEANNSPEVVAALLAASPNLATFELKDLQPTLHPTLLAAFPLFADHLTTLTLSGNIPPLASVLSSFTALTRLVVNISSLDNLHTLDTLLAVVEPAIKSLTVAIVSPVFGGGFALGSPLLQPIWERLVMPSWAGCVEIKAGMYRQHLPSALGGPAFLARCEERGIAVTFVE